jgi:hypothetical protein
MTIEEIQQERSWLKQKANKGLPDYASRLDEHNRQVDIFNKDIDLKSREAIKSLKVGDIVYLPERFKRKGLWRVEKLMVKNALLTQVGDSRKLKASGDILIKVQEEDESLINSLDDIGLI